MFLLIKRHCYIKAIEQSIIFWGACKKVPSAFLFNSTKNLLDFTFGLVSVDNLKTKVNYILSLGRRRNVNN